MRAIWSGVIQFGLVAMPVRLYAATEEHPVRLHEIHTADGSRVEHRRFCRAEDREIPYEEVGRGFSMPDGRMVPLTDEDLAHLPLPTKRTIEVLGFVPGENVDPISYSRPYYAGPSGPEADRSYVLLVEALARTGFVGVAKIAIRSRERLALLRPRNGILVLQTLLWDDELRDPGDIAPSAPVTDRELELAEVLIRELTGIEVHGLHDEYAHALEQLVAAKAGGGAPAELEGEGVPAVDLMAALEESVRAARAARGD
ncbi:non-homologous end joining protein Ku [Streptomyces lunaelactis]|uniref:non-homologous end joining protein Ku n=1 Tax=Streptomyces lunaelactis TaxID=1535768 RepID=UPI0015854857|nr:Ku protein [Streptomyces lunaelactis]NUK23701.1 Ku protein [Streptomyces lunaelactis]